MATVTEEIRETLTTELTSCDVEIERRAVDRVVEGRLPTTRVEGDITIIPVVQEVVTLVKNFVVVEEIRVRRISRQETVDVPIKRRTQSAKVDRY